MDLSDFMALVILPRRKGPSQSSRFDPPRGHHQYPLHASLAQGHRSEHLTKLHKQHPVIRIGPNALSFGGVYAIKVRSFAVQIPSKYTKEGWS